MRPGEIFLGLHFGKTRKRPLELELDAFANIELLDRDIGGEQQLDAAIVELVDEADEAARSEEHTSELQSLMRISYAVFCLKKKKNIEHTQTRYDTPPKKQQ